MQCSMNQVADGLVSSAANNAMRACAEYLRLHDAIPTTDEQFTRITELTRECLKADMDSALADAKQAIDANMIDAAVATFLVSMRLSGVRAAKLYLGHN